MSRFCMVIALITTLLLSAQAAELPKPSWVEQELSRLKEQPEVNAEAIKGHETLLSRLNQIQQKQQQLDQLSELLTQFPQRKLTLQGELEKYNNAQATPSPVESAEAVEQELATVRARVEDWNRQLLTLNEQAKQLLLDQETLPAAIAEQDRALQEVPLNGTAPATQEPSDQLKVWLNEAQWRLGRTNLDWLQLNQKTLEPRRELTLLESQVLQRRLALAEKHIDTLQSQLLEQRAESSRKLNEQARRLSRALYDAPAIVQQWNEKNEVLAQQTDELTRELFSRQRERQQLEEQQQQLTQTLSQIRANIDWLKLSPAFSASIRAQLANLPTLPSRTSLADRIAQAHLLRYELEQEQAKLKDIPLRALTIGEEQGLNERQINTLEGVFKFRVEVLNTLLQENERLIVELTRLEAVRAQFVAEIKQEREFLRQQQLWIRGRSALWTQFPPQEKTWLGTDSLNQTIQQMANQALNAWHGLTLIGLLLGIALYGLAKLRQLQSIRRKAYATVLGQVGRDRFRNSLLLTLFCLLAALPLPLWLLTLNPWMKMAWPTNYTLDLGNLLYTLVCVMFIWEAAANLAQPQGVLEKHLQWPKPLSAWLRKNLRRQRLIIYPLLLAMLIVEAISGEQESTLLRLLYLGLVLWLIFFLARMLKPAHIPSMLPKVLQGPLVSQILRALILLPLLAMAGLAAWGYFYAAWVMLLYHQATLAVLLGTLLLHQLGVRWLQLEQRQLAYQRVLARREEQLERRRRGEETAVDEVDESKLPVEEVSEQSMALLNVGIIIWLFAILSAIWSEGLVAFQWMQEVTVWQVSTTTEAGLAFEAISLKAAFYAVLIFLLAIFAARNIPGLLELLVLRRLNISTGGAYATTTLLRYSLILIGTIAATSTLGFHWSKLQWLVAALGVGLGFGLQEIFANLVSGIILLFERPVRVGDTITINNLSGTVTRINTRATTIVDWDKKEIVVPNKSLITEQLVNWSLTDAVTRLVVKVGVAYGSDIPLVKKLLFQVADEHPDVLADPEPGVVFLAFGASSLDFELRVFLPRLDLRIPVLDSINSRIDEIFREHGVEIAFPQMDIHFRDLPAKQNDGIQLTEHD